MLRRAKDKIRMQLQAEFDAGEWSVERWLDLKQQIHFRESQISQCESDHLIKRAQQLGIEIPQIESWWWDDSASGLPPEDVSQYLTRFGIVSVRNLIRDKRRQIFEWWYTKVILPTLQSLIPILSLLVALVTVWRK